MPELPDQVTLLDVAHEAGVSLSTASRTINGSTRKVREDLRERVLAAARKLNYAANGPAQAMARGRTNVVGLIIHDIADPYFSSIAAGVMHAADDSGVLVTLASTLGQPEREIEFVSSLRGQRARAIILAGSRVDDPEILRQLRVEVEAFERSGGQVVAISQAKLPVATVVLENRAGARALATELVRLGYSKFAVLAGPERLLTVRDRVTGFREGLTAAGVSAPAVVPGAFTRDGGYEAMGKLLDSGADIDAVFAVNDVMAVGAMAACRERGLRLPGDVALAGFDDIITLRDVHPGLTTVQLPLEEVGETALQLAVRAEDGRVPSPRIAGKIVIRDSTPPKSG